MNKSHIPGHIHTQTTSYWALFRIVFVIFSLYLMGDAFSRWDGFSYYASFSDFVPSVALASVLWSLVAVIASLVLWILFNLYDRICIKTGLRSHSSHVLVCAGITFLLGVMVWTIKRSFWPEAATSAGVKGIVFLGLLLVSIYASILIRNKSDTFLSIVQERVTPLVWLFGICVIFSVPLVCYHAWLKDQGSNIQFNIGTDSISPKNIILVTFDALTARNMSVFGYDKHTTPFIREWAKDATVFTKAEAESNFTTPATASLMTGKRVWSHRTFQIAGTPVKSGTESLPYIMKKNGFFNLALVVNPHTSVEILGMADSFDIAPIAADFSKSVSLMAGHFGHLEVMLYRVFGNRIKNHLWVLRNDFILGKILHKISGDYISTVIPPELVFNRFLKIMDSDFKKPIFAWIHILPPHDPYLPVKPYKRYFNASNKLRSFKTQELIKLDSYKYLFDYSPYPIEIQPDIDLLEEYYDEFILQCDKSFEKFIRGLDDRQMSDNTVVILSADHGESFEHGYFTHGGPFLYEQVTHIPLIIKEPEQNKGQTIDRLVEQIDIPATILDIAGIDIPVWMEGRSLIPLIGGYSFPDQPAFSMNFEENRSRGHIIEKGSIAVWDGDYKLIHYLERQESLLFNLKDDPDELKNLFHFENVTGQRLLRMILDRLEQVNERITH